MKIKRINPSILAAAFGIFGLAFAQAALAQNVVFQDDFESVGVNLAAGTNLNGGAQYQYAYANQDGWTSTHPGKSGPYWYTSYYVQKSSGHHNVLPLTALPNPATSPYTSAQSSGTFSASPSGQGSVALNLHNNTISQTLSGVQFTLGQTYTFHIEASGVSGVASNLTTAFLAGSTTEASVTFNSDGTSSSTGGATNIQAANFTGSGTTGNWQSLSFDYTPTALDGSLGNNMTLQLRQNSGSNLDVDNVVITAVPEPSILALAGIFGLGTLLLFRRRRLDKSARC